MASSEEEMRSDASGDEGEGVEDMEVSEKGASVKKTSHPPYGKMLVEAIREHHQQQTSRNTGISKGKIVEYMKTKYNLEDVNANAFKKAVKVAEENEIIEHKTGTGVSGSFILTKKERESDKKKASKPAEKPAEAKVESKPKPKPKPTAKPAKGKAKATEVKDTKKKPPLPKGKENKEVKEKPKKETAVKKPALSKSRSNSKVTSVVDDAVPSTSKQRKPPPAKKAKSSSKVNA